MRIGGLASGMDTDQMIKDLMKIEQLKVDRIEGDKKLVEWQRDTLNSLNKDFANFILDSKKDFNYINGARPNTEWARSATSSNETVGTASAGRDAVEGSHRIEVNNLAEGVSLVGDKIKLDDLNLKNGFKFAVNGVDIELMYEEVEEIETTIDEETEEEIENKVTVKRYKFKVDGKEVKTIKAGSNENTLKELGKVISKSDSGVNASYNESLGRFFISTTSVGSEAEIKFKADNSEAFENIFGIDLKNSEEQDGIYKGKDANITYNGAELDISSNQFNISGINFDLRSEGTFTVNVGTDTEVIVDKVKDFIDNYNSLISKAGNLLKEDKYRDYRPLTSEEKKAMSDDDIKLWEEKAKSGLIRGDNDVERMLSAIRSDLFYKMGSDDAFTLISDIGIDTQKYASGQVGGLLELDEDKLRQKLAEDPDKVLETLFKEPKVSKDENGKEVKEKGGLVNRIFDNMTSGIKNIIEKAGPGEDSSLFRKVKSNIMSDFVTRGGRHSGRGSVSDIDMDVLNYDKKIEMLQARLAKKEEMYYAQFTAMEKALHESNSQSLWLMQQFF